MVVNGDRYSQSRMLRLLEGLRAGEDAVWDKLRRPTMAQEERLSLLKAREQLAAVIWDVKAEIRRSAEADEPED